LRSGVGVLLDGLVVSIEVGFEQKNGADPAGGFDNVSQTSEVLETSEV